LAIPIWISSAHSWLEGRWHFSSCFSSENVTDGRFFC
jgi:hypothetical protein